METLLFEWYKGPRRTLSISLTAVGDLHYAALLGPNKQCGTCLHLFLIFCGEFRPDATDPVVIDDNELPASFETTRGPAISSIPRSNFRPHPNGRCVIQNAHTRCQSCLFLSRMG